MSSVALTSSYFEGREAAPQERRGAKVCESPKKAAPARTPVPKRAQHRRLGFVSKWPSSTYRRRAHGERDTGEESSANDFESPGSFSAESFFYVDGQDICRFENRL